MVLKMVDGGSRVLRAVQTPGRVGKIEETGWALENSLMCLMNRGNTCGLWGVTRQDVDKGNASLRGWNTFSTLFNWTLFLLELLDSRYTLEACVSGTLLLTVGGCWCVRQVG